MEQEIEDALFDSDADALCDNDNSTGAKEEIESISEDILMLYDDKKEKITCL